MILSNKTTPMPNVWLTIKLSMQEKAIPINIWLPSLSSKNNLSPSLNSLLSLNKYKPTKHLSNKNKASYQKLINKFKNYSLCATTPTQPNTTSKIKTSVATKNLKTSVRLNLL